MYEKIESSCDRCGLVFRKRKDRVRNPDYCCLECRKAATAERVKAERSVNCNHCGKNFIARCSQLRGGRVPYCSNSCTSSATPRTPEWNGKRAASFKANEHKPKTGKDNSNWSGGITLSGGYYRYTSGEHMGKCVHRVIMETHLGIKLTRNDVIHHINHIKTDNRIENLQVMTRAEHCSHHHKGKGI